MAACGAQREASRTPAIQQAQAADPSPQPKSIPNTQPEDGQWTMPAKDYASSRYSRLDQINIGNAKDLKLAWTFSTGVLHGHEAAPIVAGSTIYVVTPSLNMVYALDLTKPGGAA